MKFHGGICTSIRLHGTYGQIFYDYPVIVYSNNTLRVRTVKLHIFSDIRVSKMTAICFNKVCNETEKPQTCFCKNINLTYHFPSECVYKNKFNENIHTNVYEKR